MELNSAYWQSRYERNEIGWDVGTITAPLKAYIDQIENRSLRILLPGGGNSYEFDYLKASGFTEVYVLDYAEQPLKNIRERSPHLDSKYLIQADFFSHKGSYDLILEQTFFCALDPSLREHYVTHMHELLSPKGKLTGLLFQFPLTASGPPFGGSKEEYEERFSPLFTLHVLETAYNSIAPRKGNELFFIFSKK